MNTALTPTTAATPVVLPITKAIFWLAAATFLALLVHRAALRRKRSERIGRGDAGEARQIRSIRERAPVCRRPRRR